MDPQANRVLLRRVLQSVNDSIGTRAQEVAPAGRWPFWCECGADECEEHVQLDLVEYEALRARDECILAPGHSVSRGEHARRVARRLVADAEALRQQALHQQRRLLRIRQR